MMELKIFGAIVALLSTIFFGMSVAPAVDVAICPSQDWSNPADERDHSDLGSPPTQIIEVPYLA